MKWTRGEWLAMVAALKARAGTGDAPGVVQIVLRTAKPWRERQREWRRLGPGEPCRVVARPGGWWTGGRGLPDRRAAWVERVGGRAAGVECVPGAWVEEVGPRGTFLAENAVAEGVAGGVSGGGTKRDSGGKEPRMDRGRENGASVFVF